MDNPISTVGVVQGAPGATIQDLFHTLVARWQGSVRLAGVIAESHGLADRTCSAGFLRNVATDERFSMFEDLGPGSAVCHLAGAGVLTAAEAVQRDIAAGCELVVLNKFGKLEANKAGLFVAFKAAIEAGIPVLTSFSPALEEAWAKLITPSFVTLPADTAKIDAWRRTVGARRT